MGDQYSKGLLSNTGSHLQYDLYKNTYLIQRVLQYMFITVYNSLWRMKLRARITGK